MFLLIAFNCFTKCFYFPFAGLVIIHAKCNLYRFPVGNIKINFRVFFAIITIRAKIFSKPVVNKCFQKHGFRFKKKQVKNTGIGEIEFFPCFVFNKFRIEIGDAENKISIFQIFNILLSQVKPEAEPSTGCCIGKLGRDIRVVAGPVVIGPDLQAFTKHIIGCKVQVILP